MQPSPSWSTGGSGTQTPPTLVKQQAQLLTGASRTHWPFSSCQHSEQVTGFATQVPVVHVPAALPPVVHAPFSFATSAAHVPVAGLQTPTVQYVSRPVQFTPAQRSTQLPPMQVEVEVSQVFPQPPQFVGSLTVSTQTVPHRVRFAPQAGSGVGKVGPENPRRAASVWSWRSAVTPAAVAAMPSIPRSNVRRLVERPIDFTRRSNRRSSMACLCDLFCRATHGWRVKSYRVRFSMGHTAPLSTRFDARFGALALAAYVGPIHPRQAPGTQLGGGVGRDGSVATLHHD